MPPLLKSRKSKQVTLETAAVWGYRVEIADEHQEELRTLQGVCQLGFATKIYSIDLSDFFAY